MTHPVDAAAPIDTVVLRTGRVSMGAFRCPVGHLLFRDSGAISECLVVFPRTSVRIRHEGSAAFVADPTIATIYNRGQRYERSAVSGEGDRCDWFAVTDELARDIVGAFDARAAESDRPFRFEWAPSTAEGYYRQRRLLERARRGAVDAMDAEEEVMRTVGAVISAAYGRTPQPRARSTRALQRHRELADAARVELLATLHLNRSVNDIATALGVSPFHLCRVFHACVGKTMNAFRNELRVRRALELLEAGQGGARSLSTTAHDLGFASHSHFVVAMRRHFRTTPSDARRLLARHEVEL